MKSYREKRFLLRKRILQSYADYRVTVSAVALLTVYEAVRLFFYIFDKEIRQGMLLWKCFEYEADISVFMLLFICAAMFTESLLPYTEKERKAEAARILCFLLAVVIAGIDTRGMSAQESAQLFHVSRSVINRWSEQFAMGYVLLLLLGTVCFCHRKSGVGFIEYMLHVLVNWCVTTAVFFVLSVGAALVLSAADTLFFDNYGMLDDIGVILVTGLYYVPGCMTAMQNTDSDIETPLGKLLLRYVLTGMTICALLIVYVYLLKNLIVWEMPSNEIFGIVTGLFCIGMPIWLMDDYYRDDTKYSRFLQKLPCFFIPLIPVQTYAVCVRIYHNGMTPDRYMGMAMIVFEIAVLLIRHVRKEKMERIIVVSGACVCIAFLAPGINMNSLSDRWQRAFLETYYHKMLTQGSLTQTEYERLKGAYHYLERRPEMAPVVEACNIYEENFASGLPVDFSAFRFYKREGEKQEIVIADISDFAERCMAYEEENPDAEKEEISEAMRPYRRITTDDGRELYLNHFEVRYREGIRNGEARFEIESVNVSGMLLSR